MPKGYTVSRTKADSGEDVFYVHMVGFPYIPVADFEGGTFKATKREAFKLAAQMNCVERFSMPDSSIGYYQPNARCDNHELLKGGDTDG